MLILARASIIILTKLLAVGCSLEDSVSSILAVCTILVDVFCSEVLLSKRWVSYLSLWSVRRDSASISVLSISYFSLTSKSLMTLSLMVCWSPTGFSDTGLRSHRLFTQHRHIVIYGRVATFAVVVNHNVIEYAILCLVPRSIISAINSFYF